MPGLYFEEFSVGQKITSVARTVAESDILTFAGLTGDYNQIHTDAEFAKGTQFGGRVAHGLLGLSLAVGLLMRTGVLEGTVLAFREIVEWKFIKPVFIGDTLHVEMETKELKPMPRIGGGQALVALDVKNQKNETLMRGTLAVLVASKP
ncbi:MAG: dehydratase [Chloroflexi bacterium RIFOXYD12_FULL_57_15]|nr:MAG: dehydratase [Chloroflexi bacterium RIFOXYD12_FULL_57_15]